MKKVWHKKRKVSTKDQRKPWPFHSTVPLRVLCLSRVAVFSGRLRIVPIILSCSLCLNTGHVSQTLWVALCAESLIMINQWNPCICMEYSYWYYLLWHECTHVLGCTRKKLEPCTKVREEPNDFQYIWVTLTTANYIRSEHFLHKFLDHFLK